MLCSKIKCSTIWEGQEAGLFVGQPRGATLANMRKISNSEFFLREVEVEGLVSQWEAFLTNTYFLNRASGSFRQLTKLPQQSDAETSANKAYTAVIGL